MPCAGRAPVLPHTALQHQHKHQTSPVARRAWKKGREEGKGIWGHSPLGAMPRLPLPSVNTEGSARAVSVGNEAQLPAAPSPADRAVPSPTATGAGGLHLCTLGINISIFPGWRGRGRGVHPRHSAHPTAIISLVLNKPERTEGTGFPTTAPLVISLPQCHIPALNTHQCARG